LHRMSTIETAGRDDSFMGRVVAWRMNAAIADERPLIGGGFYAGNVDWVAKKYSRGELPSGKAAHSIFFEVLGDHGYVGLGLYLAIIAAAWLNTWIVLSLARQRADLAWAGELARMLQISQVAFLVGGSALSMAYYEGELMLLALTATLLQVARRPAEASRAAVAPGWKAMAAPAPVQVSARRKAGSAPVL
jgi:probable O-glycosylation ligase (exosortase A-associated)